MADIDLETDMVEAHHPTATYWVRYALVDLLGFEHSFTKPKRMILIGPGLAGAADHRLARRVARLIGLLQELSETRHRPQWCRFQLTRYAFSGRPGG